MMNARRRNRIPEIMIILITVLFTNMLSGSTGEKKQKFKKGPYWFDGTISRQVLENYLDRSVTMGYFLVPGTPERYEFPYRHDDIRLIRNTGAKFIGRAIYRWSEESKLNDPEFTGGDNQEDLVGEIMRIYD